MPRHQVFKGIVHAFSSSHPDVDGDGVVYVVHHRAEGDVPVAFYLFQNDADESERMIDLERLPHVVAKRLESCVPTDDDFTIIADSTATDLET